MKNKDLKTFYDGVYERGESHHYTKLRHARRGLSQDKIAVLATLPWKGKMVLDVGCGTGEVAYHIARRGAARVVGIDYAPQAVKVASETYRGKNLEYRCEDVADTKGKFDVILSMGTLEHIDDPLALLKRMKAMLRPGGSIVITSPNWSNPRGYILMTLRALFGAKITLVDIHYFTPPDFAQFAKKLGMKLSWRTTEQDWAHGKRLVEDFTRRLPRLLADVRPEVAQERIDDFIRWIETRVVPIERDAPHTGAIGVYHFRK
jgi:2-polyprenyl-3-methyl-5-hydroxy-6-metoxy-1,4-benzoquinol methylase